MHTHLARPSRPADAEQQSAAAPAGRALTNRRCTAVRACSREDRAWPSTERLFSSSTASCAIAQSVLAMRSTWQGTARDEAGSVPEPAALRTDELHTCLFIPAAALNDQTPTPNGGIAHGSNACQPFLPVPPGQASGMRRAARPPGALTASSVRERYSPPTPKSRTLHVTRTQQGVCVCQKLHRPAAAVAAASSAHSTSVDLL